MRPSSWPAGPAAAVQVRPPCPDADPARQRQVVDAFLAAARDGDFDALVAVLDPDVVLRAESGDNGIAPSAVIRGAAQVAGGALTFARLAPLARPVLVNGGPGAATVANGKVLSVAGFTVVGDRIVEINILADPDRLARLDLSFLTG